MEYQEIVQNWQQKRFQTEVDIDRELRNFRVLFAYHSGKIKNHEVDFYDVQEIFNSGRISSFSGNARTLIEEQNQWDCYEILKAKIARKEPIDMELIRMIHFELTKGTYNTHHYLVNGERPGEFKKHVYRIGSQKVGVAIEDVVQALQMLLEEVRTTGSDQDNQLTIAAYFHANFKNILPFAIGNGRVGRVLMNYYLMTNNHPPITVFQDERNPYYATLEVFNVEKRLEPLIDFLKRQCVRTWK